MSRLVVVWDHELVEQADTIDHVMSDLIDALSVNEPDRESQETLEARAFKILVSLRCVATNLVRASVSRSAEQYLASARAETDASSNDASPSAEVEQS